MVKKIQWELELFGFHSSCTVTHIFLEWQKWWEYNIWGELFLLMVNGLIGRSNSSFGNPRNSQHNGIMNKHPVHLWFFLHLYSFPQLSSLSFDSNTSVSEDWEGKLLCVNGACLPCGGVPMGCGDGTHGPGEAATKWLMTFCATAGEGLSGSQLNHTCPAFCFQRAPASAN